jgi:nucleoside-diphosphate-sugar epimerase
MNLCKFLLHKPEFTVWSYDSKRGSRGEDFTDVLGYQAIVLLAAFPGVINCRANMKKAVIDNLSVAFNIMNQAAVDKVPVIFTSSQAAKQPFDNFYATIKRIIEIEALRLNKAGADNRILRLTNVYGGVGYIEKKNTVIKQFIVARQNKIKMVVNGDGSQIRDFIHVKDVCNAIYLCLLNDQKLPEPVDIGTGTGISIKQLAEKFGTLFTSVPDSDTIGAMKSVAETKTADKLFNFHARESLTTYLEGV